MTKNTDALTWLAVVRLHRGLTQRELAEKAAISQVQLSRYENGHRSPRIATARRIADALEVDIDTIFASDGPSPMEVLLGHL